eukprot:144719-Chlamydomonas_euryale.AAC.3
MAAAVQCEGCRGGDWRSGAAAAGRRLAADAAAAPRRRHDRRHAESGVRTGAHRGNAGCEGGGGVKRRPSNVWCAVESVDGETNLITSTAYASTRMPAPIKAARKRLPSRWLKRGVG